MNIVDNGHRELTIDDRDGTKVGYIPNSSGGASLYFLDSKREVFDVLATVHVYAIRGEGYSVVSDISPKGRSLLEKLAKSHDTSPIVGYDKKQDRAEVLAAGYILNAMHESAEKLRSQKVESPFCNDCGHVTVRKGNCFKCLNCGHSVNCT